MSESLHAAEYPEDLRPAARPLPLFLVLLLGYVFSDAAIRLYHVGQYLLAQETITRQDVSVNFEHMVIATCYLLLFLQVLLRTVVARFWGTLLFVARIGHEVFEYGVRHPEEWVALGAAGRLQVFCRLFFFLLVVIFLNRATAKEILRA